MVETTTEAACFICGRPTNGIELQGLDSDRRQTLPVSICDHCYAEENDERPDWDDDDETE